MLWVSLVLWGAKGEEQDRVVRLSYRLEHSLDFPSSQRSRDRSGVHLRDNSLVVNAPDAVDHGSEGAVEPHLSRGVLKEPPQARRNAFKAHSGLTSTGAAFFFALASARILERSASMIFACS